MIGEVWVIVCKTAFLINKKTGQISSVAKQSYINKNKKLKTITVGSTLVLALLFGRGAAHGVFLTSIPRRYVAGRLIPGNPNNQKVRVAVINESSEVNLIWYKLWSDNFLHAHEFQIMFPFLYLDSKNSFLNDDFFERILSIRSGDGFKFNWEAACWLLLFS